MASFEVVFESSAERDLRRLDRRVLLRVLRRIGALADDPFPRLALKLPGTQGLRRLRVGDYRIIYGVNVEDKAVTIHYIRHRRDVYRDLA